MANQPKITVDCGAGTTTRGTLTAAEQAAYDAQQPVGAAQAAAFVAAELLRSQHLQALSGVKSALTANSTLTASDVAAVNAIITAMQAGTQPTQAQLLQLLRFLVRLLAISMG